jgi:hypothetical protein
MASEVVVTLAANPARAGRSRQRGRLAGRDAERVGFGHAHVNAKFSVWAIWNNSWPPLPATIRSPMSTARMVMVPAKGAMTRWNDTSSCSRRTLARSESTLAAAVSRAAAFSAASCSETDAVFSKCLPPRIGRLGEVKVGLGKCELSLGLLELLVQVRRLDLRQQLAGLDMRPDIRHPVFEVAVGAGIDGGFPPGPDFRGQDQSVPRF